MLKSRLGAAAGRVAARQPPSWLVRGASNEKATRLLDWAPRSNEESVAATAERLLRLGLLKDNPKKAA